MCQGSVAGVKVLEVNGEKIQCPCQGVDGGKRQQKQPRERRKIAPSLLANLL